VLGRELDTDGLAGLTGRRLSKPVIAALNGDALDGGLEVALACHLVVAEEHVRLGLTQTRRGGMAAHGGLARLAATLPDRVANRMVLTGQTLDAAEAARWGVVNEVVPRGRSLETARALAAEVVASSPRAVTLSLGVLDDVRQGAEAEATTATALDRLLVTSDAAEGFLAQLAGRDPEWRNR
jgi:acetyl-CoA C-acetyltransferase